MIIVSGDAVLKTAVMCAVEKWQYFLLPLPRVSSVQHSASGTADHLWDTSCLFCWNVLPRCLAACVTLCSEVKQWVYQLSATPTSVASTYCFGLWMWKNLPCSQCSSLSWSLRVFSSFASWSLQGKAWLSWPAKATQQQLIVLSSTFVSVWIGGWSTSGGMCVMAPAWG